MMADRSIIVRLRAEVSQFKSAMTDAKNSVDDLTKGSVKDSSASFDRLGTRAAIAGAAVAVGIGLAVKSFADFDKQMSAAAAATDTTGAQLEELRNLAIKAGADTQFSATEAADGITEMGKAGVSAADILGGGLTGALNLAAAGQLDVGSAANIAATAMSQFQLAGKDLPHVADLLAAGAGKAQGSVSDLGTALNYVGPVAHSMGISIEESVGVLAEFASAGLVGEQGGTAFRGMLSSLLAPSDVAQRTMANLGISLYDVNGKFIGMQGTAQVLHDKLGGLDEATRNQALGQIFGNAQLAAATVLYQGGAAAVADWTNQVNDQGFAAEQAGKLMDNLSGDLEQLRGSLETAFIKAGSGTNDALRSMVQNATGLVNALAGIPGPALIAAGAIGALALGGPKLASTVRQYVADLDALGLSMDKISAKSPLAAKALSGLAAVGAAAAVAALAVEVKNLAANASVGTPKIDDLSSALDSMAKSSAGVGTNLNSTQGFLQLFTTKGLFRSTEITNVSDALKDFGANAKAALDPEIYERFTGTADQALSVYTTRVNQIDAALAQMVSSGHGDEAARIVDQLSQSTVEFGGSADKVRDSFTQYNAAVKESSAANGEAGSAADAAKGPVADLAAAQQDAAKAAQDAAKANDDLVKSLSAVANQVLGARDSQRGFEAAVDAADDAIKKNGKTLDITTEKGRANQAAIDGIASSTLNMVTQTFQGRDANTSLADAVKIATDQVQKGRDAFIDHAAKAGMSRDAAARLADQLGLTKDNVARLSQTIENVPDKTSKVDADITPAQKHLDQVQARMDAVAAQKPTPVVSANPQPAYTSFDGVNGALSRLNQSSAAPLLSTRDQASSGIGFIDQLLDRLNGRVATVTVQTRVVGPSPAAIAAMANGSMGPTGFAAGGPVVGPGTGTSDTAGLFALSNGEHVITAAEVAAAGGHGAVFALRKALLTGGVQYRADGGPVTTTNYIDQSHGVTSTQTLVIPAAAPAGPAVFQLYDSDGVLMGTMRGVARQETGRPAAMAALGRKTVV